MINFRSLIPHVAVLCGLCVGAPASALASPLLSGYGGPGQGSQVILGSALVNGPRGGGGSSGGGSSNGGGPAAPATVTQAGTGGGTVHSHSTPTRVSSTKGTAARGSEPHRSRAASGSAARGAPVSVEGRTVSHSAALGLSSGDLVLIIVAACALAAIGFMTGRLARVPRHEGPLA